MNLISYVKRTMIEMVRGDTLSFGAIFDDLAADLADMRFTIKSADSQTALVQLSLGDGITKADMGKYIVNMEPSKTASVAPGRYPFDCEYTTADGERFTPLWGYITLLQDYS